MTEMKEVRLVGGFADGQTTNALVNQDGTFPAPVPVQGWVETYPGEEPVEMYEYARHGSDGVAEFVPVGHGQQDPDQRRDEAVATAESGNAAGSHREGVAGVVPSGNEQQYPEQRRDEAVATAESGNAAGSHREGVAGVVPSGHGQQDPDQRRDEVVAAAESGDGAGSDHYGETVPESAPE